MSTQDGHSTPPRARKAPRKVTPAWYLQGQLDNGTDRVGRGHATLCKQRVYSREDSGKCKRFRGQRHEAEGLAGESAGGRSRWGCAGK